jgi:hypothetical protein
MQSFLCARHCSENLILIHLTLTTTLCGKTYNFHFTNEDIEAEMLSHLPKVTQLVKWEGQNSHQLVRFHPFFLFLVGLRFEIWALCLQSRYSV